MTTSTAARVGAAGGRLSHPLAPIKEQHMPDTTDAELAEQLATLRRKMAAAATDEATPEQRTDKRPMLAALRAARWAPRAEVDKLRARVSELEGPAAETPIGSITIRSESIQLDNGECLRDLAVGDSVELRPGTGHEGLWIVGAFHGDYQDRITLQYAEVVEDCGNDPVTACKFSGTRHAHPVDLDGKVRPRPTP